MIRLLSGTEMGDATGFRQQLGTTSFEASELEIAVNYPVHTWTGNASFTWNLTRWLVPFRLVLLTEHKVIRCYAPNAVCRAWLLDNCTRGLADSLQQTIDASEISTVVGKFTQQPSCTIPLWQTEILKKIRIASSCEIFMILFNVYWYLGVQSFSR